MSTKRNYQDIIFQNSVVTNVEYLAAQTGITSRSAFIYQPEGDIETKRFCAICLHAGGGEAANMRQWCNDITSRGGVAITPDYGDTGADDATGFDTGKQIAALINVAALLRWIHKNHVGIGVAGSKIAVLGVSAGGLTAWNLNVVLTKILTDSRFVSPVNDVYPFAKMSIIGTASMPGALNPSFVKDINSSNLPHFAYAGTRDPIFAIQTVRDDIAAMQKVGVKSVLTEYPSDHSLTGFHDAIVKSVMESFAGLMGIAPVNSIPS